MSKCGFCCGGESIVSKFHETRIEFIHDSFIWVIRNKDICPPFAKCCDKDMIPNLATDIDINFCPICGRKLRMNNE